ncbi:prfB [Wigglesworthia glossinidia endosymbiont of Glossina brevipalpis]|uniref:Peptide chain release factor 2 n=1 Tax=Wigglesworthia glossinidia brevipalpis TaxID=36870 RepID=Q8D2B4_WIGBR|nr:prfB [Wigglesworthia glossinidia endosymbiont of Glossina brevipalpis]
MSLEENDSKSLLEVNNEIILLNKRMKKIELMCYFFEKNDRCNCYMDIQPGSGGIDAQDWASILLRMYLKWADRNNFKTDIIYKSSSEIAGIKSATVKFLGSYAYGWLKKETGIHRLVRKSPFDSNGKRHTSFCSIFVYPDINDKIEIKINLSDLRIDVYRSSGAGGQHVNRTESAVRITHLPTKITTQCQSDRSQHKNKEKAINQLKSKLYEFELRKKNKDKKIIEKSKSKIAWGNQIRSYIFDNSIVKDLRTGIESKKIQSILDGDLNIFLNKNFNI